MLKRIVLFLLFVFFSINAIAAIPDSAINFFWNEDPIKVDKGGEVSEKITLQIPAGYSVYADKTDLEFLTLEGVRVLKIVPPSETMKIDPIDGSFVPVYTGGQFLVQLQVPDGLEDGIYDISAILHYQACSEKLCLRPAEQLISWTLHVGDAGTRVLTSGGGIVDRIISWLDIARGKASDTILNVPLGWLFLIAFIGGILSSFTPCILPLIPITMLIIGVKPHGKWRDNFLLALFLVTGMSVTYAILGMLAAVMGLSLGFLFQSRLFLAFVVIFFFFMGLSLMGVYTFQLPSRVRNGLSRLGGGGLRGAFFAGISMGLLATPCVGPIIATLLVYAASAGRLSISFTLLLTYSMGLGIVIIIVGSWYGTTVGRLKKARAKWVKKLIGILLIVMSLYYLNSLIPFARFFEEAHPIGWQTEQNVESPYPKMILFTADWCPPCKVLDAIALRNVEVVKLSRQFLTVKIDMTQDDYKKNILARKYGVVGWPTIVFTSGDGKSYDDLKVFGGYISGDTLAKNMKKALLRSGVKSGK